MALADSGDSPQQPATVTVSPPSPSANQMHYGVFVRNKGVATLDRCQLVGKAIVFVEAGSTVRTHLNIAAGLPMELEQIYLC